MIINSLNDIIVTVNDRVLEENNDYIFEKGNLIFTKAPEPNDKISVKKRIENDKTNN